MSELALKLINECYETKNPYLDLGKCSLGDTSFSTGGLLEQSLKRCTHLQTLIISNVWTVGYGKTAVSKNNGKNNYFSVLPSVFAELHNLTTFICAGDPLKWEIQDWSIVTRLTNLQYLDASFNQINTTERLDRLSNLRHLNLSCNRLLKTDGLGSLSSLEELNLRINKLAAIAGLDHAVKLQRLFLGFNYIKEVSGLDRLSALQELDLSHNNIGEMKGIQHLHRLQSLNFTNNKIRHIQGLENLRRLQSLELGNNQLEEIQGLESLNSLQYVDLSFNNIEELKGLDHLTNLQELEIRNNIIRKIAGLANCINLKKLYLRKNKLQEAKGLDTLVNLQKLDVQDNPFNNPPWEVIARGREAIVNYYRELEKQGEACLYEAKMLIVGQPRSGKTSLRYKLLDSQHPLPGEDTTTRGIDIDRLTFTITDKDGNLRQFHYNVWDFGGQQIYQTTHQFFLTHRSLYVLVMDTGKDSIGNDDTTINYWLQAVELLGGNSPLLLVLNEKNERKIQIDLPQKKGRFPFLKDDYVVDLNALIAGTPKYNRQREIDFQRLQKDIETSLSRLPLVGLVMPKNWVQIRKALLHLSRSHPYISLDRYIAICQEHDVLFYERQMELSRIFHDLGIFLHFQDYGNLADFIVLQNTWATDAVFAVLDNATVRASNGRFNDADLPGIWEPKGYERIIHKKLLGLMMQFELCYQVDKTKDCTYIVPEMLPDSAPAFYSWQPAHDLPLQYRYDFMPKGLLTRLIVRLNRHIYTEHRQQAVWKTGVRIDGNSLDCPHTHAEITEAWDNRQLNIRIQGGFAKDLMSKISYEIDELNKDYFKQIGDDDQDQKSRWYKMIPCNCIACKETNNKHFYDHSELLKRKAYGKDTIECTRIPFAAVNIHALLDGVFSKEDGLKGNNRLQEPRKIFISYSKDDLPLVNKFIEHLSALQLEGKVAHWYCTELIAGTSWNKDIQDHFDQSDIVCFMVSPHFMKTAYIHEHEIKKAFERQSKDPTFKIVPIILDFCKWTTSHNNLGQFTALPYTAKPVVDFKNQNMAWYIVQECLRLMIEQDLNPTGEDFYATQALPKDVLKLLERIVMSNVDA